MDYTTADFMRDVMDPDCVHLESRERFKAFYEVLGQSPIQKAQQVISQRIDFIKPQGPRIIELGCHVGFNSIHFAQQGFNVVGVDIALSLLVEAERRKAELTDSVRSRLRFVRSWIEDLNLDEPPFNDVILTEVLEHAIDPAEIVIGASKWLAKDGSMWISAPNTRTGNYSHVRGVTHDDLIGWLHNAGLVVHVWHSNATETAAEAGWA